MADAIPVHSDPKPAGKKVKVAPAPELDKNGVPASIPDGVAGAENRGVDADFNPGREPQRRWTTASGAVCESW